MSIIGMHYFTPMFDSNPDHVLHDLDTNPRWIDSNANLTGNSYDPAWGTPNFYYKRLADMGATGKDERIPNGAYDSAYKLPSTLPDEFWFRYVWKVPREWSSTTANNSSYRPDYDKEIFSLRAVPAGATDGIARKLARAIIGSNHNNTWEIYWETFTYNIASGKYTTTSSSKLGDIRKCIDVSTHNCVIQLRVKLGDGNTAGVENFVQLYNHQNKKVDEWLGKTIETGAVPTYGVITHTGIRDPGSIGENCAPLFGIIADEKTFGMWLAPLQVKAAGTYNTSDNGTSFQNLTGFKLFPNGGGFVSNTVAQGETKKFTAKVESLTEVGLPAGYDILAVSTQAIFETDSSQGIAIPHSMILKTGDTPQDDFTTPVETIEPNTNNTADRRWQTRNSPIYATNPKTNAAWALADFEKLEIGYTVTGV